MMRRIIRSHRGACGCIWALTMMSGCHRPGKYWVEESQGAVLPAEVVSNTKSIRDGGASGGADASTPHLESLPDARIATSSSRGETILDGGRSSQPNTDTLTRAELDSSVINADGAAIGSCDSAGRGHTDCLTAQDCGWARAVGRVEHSGCIPGGRFRQVGTREDDASTSIAFAPDGSVWLAGRTAGKFPGQPSNQWDAFLRGWMPDGTTSWTRQVIGDEGLDYPALAATSRGRLVLAATELRFDGPRVILIHAFDLAGAESWTQRVEGELDVEVGGIVAAPDGGVYVSGWRAVANVNDAGERSGIDFVSLYDHDGVLVRTSEVPAIEMDEPSIVVLSRALAAWPDGSVLLSATRYSDLGMFPFGGKVALTKLSPTGVVKWQRVLDAEGELTNQMAIDRDGNIVFGSRSEFEGVVHKLSPEGEPMWAVAIGPITHRFPKVATDPSGNIYAVVTTNTGYSDDGYDGFGSHHGSMDIAVSSLSPAGDVIWRRQFGTPEDDVAAGIGWTAKAAYVHGETHGDFAGAHGGEDAFVVQVAPSQW